MKRIEQFFCYCSGVSISILKRCPTEISKFVGIGAAVFFTGLLAAISSAYALYFVFDGLVWPIVFGLIWGLMIFNLDRLIVLSMRKSHKNHYEYMQAIPRLLLAILIALVISKPLELKIFDKEIATELNLIKQELLAANENIIQSRYNSKTDSLHSEIESLKHGIKEKEEIRDHLLDVARQEADGTGGSGKVNPGPIYQIKKNNADQAQAELEEIKRENGLTIEKIRNDLQLVERSKNSELSQIEVADINGVSFQLTALARLGEKYDTIYYANVFIILLFIMLEIAPILGKLLTPRGPYDDLLEVHEKHFESYRKEKVYQAEKSVEDYIFTN
ncbi:protein of unknown function [Reichenbachiella faecimaris]|uniref:DUF4407 domain-containing protein n=1 Tax=Reichenbachiella faecimaris TaxID=692418 RepID=A0A1W2GHR9_REIFA|nr:DUF4407 domain-containing protein [Reichenbachiella faecimaris]SMD36121.1 protein of unknown function [Reichenbachiella faecimaris]